MPSLPCMPRISIPGVSRSTTNAVVPRWPLERSVDVNTTMRPACSALVMNIFDPLIA